MRRQKRKQNYSTDRDETSELVVQTLGQENIVEELIPEGQKKEKGGHSDITTIGYLVGFTVMMVLDVALG